MNSPYSIAQETLAMSDRARNIPGMTSRVRPGSNAMDDPATNPAFAGVQEMRNQQLAGQNQLQNIESAAPQSAANAMRGVGRQIDQTADAEFKAQQFAAGRMSEALYANQSGSALMKMNAIMQSPEKSKFMNDIAMGKAMSEGLNPDLGSEVAQKVQYM